MTTIYTRPEIDFVLDPAALITLTEGTFVAYSRNGAAIQPVGEMLFENPPGDCHIECGSHPDGEIFTVKITTSFWNNAEPGSPSSDGVVLVFSKKTGVLLTVLQDGGHLAEMCTAAAGAVAAKYLAPRNIQCIGIVGTGIQAELQLKFLRHVTTCRKVRVCARNIERASALHVEGFDIEAVSTPRELAATSQLIVTTTAGSQWLLDSNDVRPGTHITAVGASGGNKTELDPRIFSRASICAVDCLIQCSEYGNTSFALAKEIVKVEHLVELGSLIEDPSLGRLSDDEITIADLTGLAVQDVAIANFTIAELAALKQAMQPGLCCVDREFAYLSD